MEERRQKWKQDLKRPAMAAMLGSRQDLRHDLKLKPF
jgi:hypothetical protein